MRIYLAAIVCLMATASTAGALGREGGLQVDSVPITAVTQEEIGASSARSMDDILNAIPSPTDLNIQRADLSQAQINLRGSNAVFLDGRKLTKKQERELGNFLSPEVNAVPQTMIDRIEVLKDGAASIYGGDAVAGVISITTKYKVFTDDLSASGPLSAQETKWVGDGLSIGRIGIGKWGTQYNYGLSTYTNDKWDWQMGQSLGQSYGLHGPVIALGKTPQGQAFSIFNDYGARIGDVTKAKIDYDPGITGRYLIRAEYKTFNIPYNEADRAFKPADFDPYGAIVLRAGGRMGDLYQIGDRLNDSLEDYDDYDDYYDEYEDDECYPPYRVDRVIPRHVLKKREKEPDVPMVPNDPLYKKAKAKKKGGIPLVSGLVSGVVSVGAGVVGVGELNQTDNDGPAVYDQYSLSQIGFLPKTDPASAWNLVDSETKNVTVAVIDSGLDVTHIDGPQYLWTNEKETPGNNIDDDNNGYIDDVNGWNFLDENNDLTDLRGHGTIVAGIIAARTNNGQGIAGINPGAVIMPLKVADKNGNTNSLNIFRAVKYAVHQGAKVINISLGAPGVSQLEQLAINFARTKGVLVVVASGNDGEDLGRHGPGSLAQALAVGAMNFDGTRSTVSNWGPNNALMAPGEEIYSLHSKDAPWDGPSGVKQRLYTKVSGTSFSAPMAAATASLLLVKDPKLTPDDLEDILLSTAKKTDGDWNARTGAGVLDASKALSALDQPRFNVRITGVDVIYDSKGKKMEAVNVYATVRGAVDHFTVELGKGKQARSFKPVIGIDRQQANNDLVAHLTAAQLRGSNEWQVLVRAKDLSGKEHTAQTPLILK